MRSLSIVGNGERLPALDDSIILDRDSLAIGRPWLDRFYKFHLNSRFAVKLCLPHIDQPGVIRFFGLAAAETEKNALLF